MPTHLPSYGVSIFLISATLLLAYHTFFTYPYQAAGVTSTGVTDNEASTPDPMAWIKEWQRPDVAPTVGLQVGHWKNEELPAELASLIGNTGAVGGDTTEVELNLRIAQSVAQLLKPYGVQVDILPATVPPDYWADAFIAIHADGSHDPAASGYKVAGPWRDVTGNSTLLVSLLEAEYEGGTNLPKDPNITRNMRGYYAFSWWKYDHSIHPMTTAAIVETGFITSPSDRKVIVAQHHLSAQALAKGIIAYLKTQDLPLVLGKP